MTEWANRTDPCAGGSSADDSSRAACPIAVNAGRSPYAPAVVASGGGLSWAMLEGMIRERVRMRAGAPDVLAVRATRSTDLIVELFAAARRGRAIALVSPRLPAGPAERFVHETRSTWVDSAAQGSGPEDPDSSIIQSPGAPLTYMQTSGSSGRPRTIAHSWLNHVASARMAVGALHLTERDRWHWSLPPHHVGGLSILFRCVTAGAAIVLPGAPPPGLAGVSDHRRSAHKQTLRSRLIESESTIVSCVPLQLRRMIDEGPCPASVRDVIVGGAPIEAELIDMAVAAGYPVRTTYGCTESASMMTLSERFDEAPERVHAGRPLRPESVAVDSDGSIRLRGKTLAIGRLKNGTLRPILDADGWYRSRDEGVFDDDGNLVIGGRVDDVIVSGGENISTRSLERALLELDRVRSVIVVPVPDTTYGQRPVAFIESDVPAPGEAKIREHLGERLPGFMHPDAVIPLGPPPEGYLKWPRHLLIERAIAAGKD